MHTVYLLIDVNPVVRQVAPEALKKISKRDFGRDYWAWKKWHVLKGRRENREKK